MASVKKAHWTVLMWRLLLGFLLGSMFMAPLVDAVRLPAPPTITQWNEGTMAQLNTYLQLLWQLTNGRYTVEVTTTNPNGNRVGTQGDLIAYNNAGSWKKCLNISATTSASPTGTTWRCDASALTAP